VSASWALQKLIYRRLVAYPDVAALVDDRVYDNPSDEAELPYITFGPSDWVEDDAECITARTETLQIDCWSRYQGGFMEAKQLSDAVKAALHQYDGTLEGNALVEMRVTTVRTFRDPDGITSHGVVTVQAMVEEG
jgi:hypothetical protein